MNPSNVICCHVLNPETVKIFRSLLTSTKIPPEKLLIVMLLLRHLYALIDLANHGTTMKSTWHVENVVDMSETGGNQDFRFIDSSMWISANV